MTVGVIETLVANHRQFLAFLERRVGDRADAEDILQSAFVRAIEKSDGLRDNESAVAWFYRLLRNALVDYYRRQGAQTRAAAGAAAEHTLEPDDELHREVCRCVGQLLTTLKPEYADLLRQVELEDVPVAQVAQRAGITANNASVRLFRARQALLQEVRRSCRTCAAHGCLDCTCGGLL